MSSNYYLGIDIGTYETKGVLVDIDGKVISGSDGYTIPLDSNGSGIYDFMEAGIFMKTKNIILIQFPIIHHT